METYNFNSALRGCSSVGRPHAALVGAIAEKSKELGKDVNHVLKTRPVETITVSMLYDKGNVTSIGYMKIDAELHSVRIAKSMVRACETVPSSCPKMFSYEIWRGVNAEDQFHQHKKQYETAIVALDASLEQLGYSLQGEMNPGGDMNGGDKFFVLL